MADKMVPKQTALDAFEEVDVKPLAPAANDPATSSPPPSSPTKKARKTPNSTPSSTSKSPADAKDLATGGATDWTKVEGWTPEKKEAVMAHVISKGASAAGMSALAQTFGVTPKSMQNALGAGRKGNLRDKAVSAARS